MSRLPDYFKVEGCPKADDKKTVIGGCYRFTVITSRLIRCEWNDSGKFEDSFTRSVVDRNFGECSFQVEHSEEKLIIKTEHLILEYEKTGRFNSDNLSITVKGGKCWYFGTPFKTLKGTARTLDCADGVRAFEEMYSDMAKAVGIDPESEDPVKFDMSSPDFIKAYFEVLHHPYEKDGVRFWWMDWQQGTKSTIPNIDPLWVLNHYHTLDAKREGKRELIFSRFAGPG